MPAHAPVGGIFAAALLAAVASVSLVFGAVPAAAATGTEQVLISADGVSFSLALQAPLFDGLGLLVPGESVGSSVWIRNPAASPAVMRANASDVVVPSVAYAEGVIVSVWDSGTRAIRSQTLGRLAQCRTLVPSQTITGGTIRVDFTFTMGDLSGVAGQNEGASMNLVVDMQDAAAGRFPASSCDEGSASVPTIPSAQPTGGTVDEVAIAGRVPAAPTAAPATAKIGAMPSTGSAFAAPLSLASGLLLGVGILFLAGRRRKKRPQ
jgi:LPXTG-motif cell wall-anchored protein